MDKHLPEIFCDLNAGAGANGYRLTNGSFADLEKLGLTPEQAIGMQLSFNGGADTDEHGQAADIMFDGTIVKDDEWGKFNCARSFFSFERLSSF